MSGPSSHNRNPRRLVFLAAREAFWDREARGVIWARLARMRRNNRPLPMAFRLPKNGSRMRFVSAEYPTTGQHASRLHRPGYEPTIYFLDEAAKIDEAVWADLQRKDILARQRVADAFLIPPNMLGKR